ncbi:hypothetical protein LX32DRAFT_189815 [Colletotrichum zoysiae]|uniref:Uncharacterized protein n=1 Tax=Colletotrichum zoysiae TaxID=1216348 RepID=A0AAD9M356_9PEZI|nr:hypothetical protein LX32DRAFT_189815 [Colletotrichum zoysiae]
MIMLRVVNFGSLPSRLYEYGASRYLVWCRYFFFLFLDSHPIAVLSSKISYLATRPPNATHMIGSFPPWFPWSSGTSKYSEHKETNK